MKKVYYILACPGGVCIQRGSLIVLVAAAVTGGVPLGDVYLRLPR